MRRVVIESPFAGDEDLNVMYLRAALADSIARGEAPFASHAIYTQPGVLDDSDPDQRAIGICAGFEWRAVAHATAVYTDLGVSRGMNAGIAHSERLGIPVEFRNVKGWRK